MIEGTYDFLHMVKHSPLDWPHPLGLVFCCLLSSVTIVLKSPLLYMHGCFTWLCFYCERRVHFFVWFLIHCVRFLNFFSLFSIVVLFSAEKVWLYTDFTYSLCLIGISFDATTSLCLVVASRVNVKWSTHLRGALFTLSRCCRALQMCFSSYHSHTLTQDFSL